MIVALALATLAALPPSTPADSGGCAAVPPLASGIAIAGPAFASPESRSAAASTLAVGLGATRVAVPIVAPCLTGVGARALDPAPMAVAPVGVAPVGVAPDGNAIATALAPADTGKPRKRPVVIEYSDWYSRRLTIHRWASYTMIPLFAAQYAAGQQLLQKGSDAPQWARSSHGLLAGATAGLFTLNTVTGLWNLWDSRKDPAGRGRRVAHSLLMLAGDAGFTATGMLADGAENSQSTRLMHRNVAIGSMAVSLVGYLMMTPLFGRD